MNEGHRYECLVLGAGFYGCGLAANRKNTRVVEAEILAGAEYALSLNPCASPPARATPRNRGAREFRDALARRGALDAHGRAHTPALFSALAWWCGAHSVDLALDTRVLDVGEHAIVVQDADGRHTWHAERVIDARPSREAGKRLVALMSGATGIERWREGTVGVTPGVFPGLAYFHVRLPAGCDWIDARETLLRAWTRRPDFLREWKINMIATRFDWMESLHPVDELDRGLSAAREGGRLRESRPPAAGATVLTGRLAMRGGVV